MLTIFDANPSTLESLIGNLRQIDAEPPNLYLFALLSLSQVVSLLSKVMSSPRRIEGITQHISHGGKNNSFPNLPSRVWPWRRK